MDVCLIEWCDQSVDIQRQAYQIPSRPMSLQTCPLVMVSFLAGNTAYLLPIAGRCAARICMLRMPIRINLDMASPRDMCSRWAFCLAMFKTSSFTAKVICMVCRSVNLFIKA